MNSYISKRSPVLHSWLQFGAKFYRGEKIIFKNIFNSCISKRAPDSHSWLQFGASNSKLAPQTPNVRIIHQAVSGSALRSPSLTHLAHLAHLLRYYTRAGAPNELDASERENEAQNRRQLCWINLQIHYKKDTKAQIRSSRIRTYSGLRPALNWRTLCDIKWQFLSNFWNKNK